MWLVLTFMKGQAVIKLGCKKQLFVRFLTNFIVGRVNKTNFFKFYLCVYYYFQSFH